MRYWEITKKEKQEYSLEELTLELNECIAEFALASKTISAKKKPAFTAISNRVR